MTTTVTEAIKTEQAPEQAIVKVVIKEAHSLFPEQKALLDSMGELEADRHS